MRRVLFASRKWPPAIGGMETYAQKLAQALSVKCELATKVLPGRQDGRPPPFWKLAIFLMSAMVRAAQRGPDVLHVGDLVLWPVALVARWRRACRQVVITAYGLDVIYGRQRGMVPAIYGAYLAAGARLLGKDVRIIAISRDTARLCREAGFKDVVVVTLGVDPPGANPAMQVVGDYVLFVGRLVRRKGAAWFAREVLPLLPAATKLVVVGKAWDDDELASLRSQARVDYRGVVGAEAIAELRRSALVVVMPNVPSAGTDMEGFGLTAVEAGADGGVLLASGIEGIVDAVVDGVTGFLLPAGDAMAWAAKIEDVRGWSASRRDAFVTAARAEIVARFTWAAVADQTLLAYDSSGTGS